MKIKANGIDINYQIDGPEGAPWIVFSNSLATSTAMWDEQAAALKDKFRVLRYDQRGHGATDAPAGRYAFDTLLNDALGGWPAPWRAVAPRRGANGRAGAIPRLWRRQNRERLMRADLSCQSPLRDGFVPAVQSREAGRG